MSEYHLDQKAVELDRDSDCKLKSDREFVIAAVKNTGSAPDSDPLFWHDYMRCSSYDYEHDKLPLVEGVSGRSKRTLSEDDILVYERACKRFKEEREKDLNDYEAKKAYEADLVKSNAALFCATRVRCCYDQAV